MENITKVGILIPKSQQYPTLDRDFMRGLKLNNLNAKFFVESIGIGSDEKVIIEKIQKLNFQEDVSVIIGFFGHHNISEVYNYASNNDILLLAAEIGATIPYETPVYKGVYINSFGLAESCYHLGHYLTNKNYQKIVTSTSFYDSGYGMLSAIEFGFKEKNLFSGHYVTPFAPRENESAQMDQFINTHQPDAVVAFYSGLYAQENAAFVSQNKVIQKYPFYVTPFFINDKILSDYKNDPHELYVVSSWMQNDSNSVHFSTEYENAYEDSPSVFSTLGYENGLILQHILLTAKDTRINSLIEEMSQLNIEGPRGNIEFDTNTNRTKFNYYMYELNFDSNKEICFNKIETFINDGHFIKTFTASIKPDQMGGWQNAYLCH